MNANESFIELFVHYFADFRKFCALQEQNSIEFIDRVDASALARFSIGLLETVLKQFDDFEEITASSVRRAAIIISTFYNAAARSPRFRKTVEKHTVLHWLTLLRFEPIRTEVLACLCIVSRELHKAFFLDDAYAQLLADLVTLWSLGNTSDEQRSWISAFFSALLEDDYGFLSECYASLEREAFTDLLVVLEALVDMTSTGKQIKIHPNNIRFCLDLFERIDFELSNSNSTFVSDTGARLTLLTDIFASAALQRPLYDDSLHNEQRAMRLICGMLRSILDAEIALQQITTSHSSNPSPSRKRTMSMDPDENKLDLNCSGETLPKVEKESDAMNQVQMSTNANSMVTSEVVSPPPSATPERHEDKPPDAKCARRDLDEAFKSSAQLQKLIRNRQISLQIIANIKQSAVRCIGNLCMDNSQNREAAAQMDAVYLVVQCGRKTENDRPFIVQWAVSSLKQLCLNCTENQEKLLNLDNQPNLTVNRDRLLQTLGLKTVVDETTGKLKLEKLDET